MDIAKIFRIFEIEINDDFVTKRENAIKNLKTVIAKKVNVIELMEFASAVCEVFRAAPQLPESVSKVITSSIQKYNKSFESENRAVDIGVTGVIAVLEYIKSSVPNSGHWHNTDVLAAAIWSVTDMILPGENVRLEELRAYALKIAQDRIFKQGLNTRKRYSVSKLAITDDLVAPQLATNVEKIVTALTANSAMDREEIDLLWWVLAGRSELLSKSLFDLNPATRAVISGIEIGSKVRYLPSQSFNNLAIKDLPDSDALFDAKTLLTEIGEHRAAIIKDFEAENKITSAPNVFPLLYALLTNDSTLIISDSQKPLSNWAARALLERAVLKVQYAETREL